MLLRMTGPEPPASEPVATTRRGRPADAEIDERVLAAGMALYVIHRTGHAVVPWLLVAGNAALATAALVPARMDSLGQNSVVAPQEGVLAAALLACVALVALVTLTPVGRWRWAGLTAAGALTYPLYLTHEYWGLWIVHLLAGRAPVAVVLAAAVTVSLLLVGVVSFVFDVVVGDGAAWTAGAVLAIVIGVLWAAVPAAMRARAREEDDR